MWTISIVNYQLYDGCRFFWKHFHSSEKLLSYSVTLAILHICMFNHYVQHKAYEAGTQPYKIIQKYVTYQKPGLFKHLKHSSLHEETEQTCFISHFVFGLAIFWGFYNKLQFSFPVCTAIKARMTGKMVAFKITFGKGRLTGLEETKTIFITTANEQQVKIHTFYITIN